MKRLFSLIQILILMQSLTALQWPLPDGAPFSSFLQNSFLLELESPQEPAPVNPAIEGEILFIYTPDDWETLALGDRSLLVLEHQNQYRTLYSLDQLHPPVKQRQILSESDLIGESRGNPLGFGVWDLRSESWVNPLLILPGRVDTQGVALIRMELRQEGEAVPLATDNTLDSGLYSLFIQAEDLKAEKEGLSLLPYRIECRYLGETIRDLEFSAADYSEGLFRLMEGDLSILSMMGSEKGWLNLGEIQVGQGRADLEITLWDFFGNSRNTIVILRGKP